MSNQRVLSRRRGRKLLTKRIAVLSLGCAKLSLVFSLEAMATGFVRLESNGFLKRSEDRSNSTSTVVIGPHFGTQGKILEANLDIQGIGFVTDRSTFTAESKNAYLATSPQLMPHHQFSIGRRQFDWSMVDDQWKMGLWTPRFLWDPFRPEQIGLTGAFYKYQSRSWRVLAYASPLSIPERGFPTREQNGRITSASPFYIEPFQFVRIQNQNRPVQYTVQYPSMSELLFNPGGAVSLRYGEKQGAWIQGTYGLMPIHQPNISVEPALLPQSSMLEVKVHPRVLHHHVITGETGFKSRELSLWTSLTGESPVQKTTSETWITAPIGNTIIAAAGAETILKGGFKLNGSLFYLNQTSPPQAEKSIDVSTLARRFEYERALRMGAEWSGFTQLTYATSWIVDLEEKSNLLSFDLNFRPGRAEPTAASGAWLLNVGTDFFTSAHGTGHIGRFVGNDRLRGGVSYVF